jgi:uncharacterized protein
VSRRSYLAAAMGLSLLGCGGLTEPGDGAARTAEPADGAADGFRVLLFTRTAGYRHDSIPAAIATFRDLQTQGGFAVSVTEDPGQLTAESLGRFAVVVFLMTSGDVLDDAQQAAFQDWIGGGGAYLGVHSASDTEYDWPFYGELVGAYFSRHPDIQPAAVYVEDGSHPAMLGLPSPWLRRDEWYDFRVDPRGAVTVLATVDEGSYVGGGMGADHPIVWAHATPAGGRAFYTAMGHTKESWSEPVFRQHVLAALRWAAGR